MNARPVTVSRYRFLFSLLLEHKTSYLFGSLMVGLTLWMTLTIPRYLQQAIDVLQSADAPDGSSFNSYIILILVFALAIIITRTGSRLFFFIPGRRVEFDLKNRLLAHLNTLQRAYFRANPTGAVISRINNDINGVRMLMGFGLLQLCNSVAMLTLAPYQMYAISPSLTLYVCLPIVAAFIALQIAIRKLRVLQQQQMKAMQDISEFTVESYNGLDVLRSYRVLGWAEQRFTDFSEAIKQNAISMATIRAYFMPILTHVVNALKVLLVFVGGILVIQADMSIGAFMAYLLYLSMLLSPLMGMSFMLFVIQRGMTALESLETVFHTQPVLPAVDPVAEQALPPVLEQGLSINHLSFSYPDDPEQRVLDGVSFSLKPGEIVGLFGPIGSGKTTLVNLINRYLTPPDDSILLDGVDVNRLSQQAVRRHLVSITQEAFLFSATIRDNVRFANPDMNDAEVLQALESAAMTDDMSRFPAGLDTIAGEKGINLSGGQKQRISLARALLQPCDVLILDDVLSAVDHETERYLIEQIYGFQQAKALLIVSHRVSALARANRIVVLEQGRVTAQGSHDELIQRPGLYRDSYLMQQEREESEVELMA